MTPRVSERRALWIAGFVACLAVFWAIWSVPLVMTNDGPEAVLTAHMEAHYDDPGSIYARQYAVGFGLSGRGFSFLYRPVAALFSWPTSLRLSQLVIVLAFAFAVFFLGKALAGRARLAGLLGFVIAFSWPFYMGFWAFSLAMAVGLMVLAFVVSKSDGLTLVEKGAVATALLVQLVMHGFAVLITLALVGLVVVTRVLAQRKTAPPAEWRRSALGEAAWLAVAALPSFVVSLILRSAQGQMAKVYNAGGTEWAKPADWAKVLPRLATPGSTALGIIVFALAIVAIVRAVLRLRRGPRAPEEVALVIGAVGLLVAALGMPLNVPGWQFFAPRFLTTGLALSLCLLAKEEPERKGVRLAFEAGVVALMACALLNARALHHRLASACEDALIGLEHRVPRTGMSLPVTFDATCGFTTDDTQLDVPYSTALLHFYSLFPVTHGGSVPYGFSGPAAVHAFVPRAMVGMPPVPPVDEYWGLSKDDPRLKAPKTRASILTELAVFGTHYENILFFGATAEDRALLLERGYVTDFEHGSFVNAHFVPCNVELVIDVLPSDPPVLVRAGLRENELWGAKITPLPGRRAVVASASTLCGDIWLRAQWQGSAARCANADADGHIPVHAERATTRRFVCERDSK